MSDSDDDIDFTAISGPSTMSSTRDTQDVRLQMFEKAGENVVLRDRLKMLADKHERQVAEIISSQQRSRDMQKGEADALRSQLKALESELQFMRAEIKMNSVGTRQARAKVPAAKQPAVSRGFTDGFTVKRPKTAESASVPEPDLLASHVTPGLDTTSLQKLYETRHLILPHRADSNETLGHLLALKQDSVSQLALLVEWLDQPYPLARKPIFLALIYAFVQHGIALTPDQSIKIVRVLTKLLKEYQPFPKLEVLSVDICLLKEDCLRLTCILYSLDILRHLDQVAISDAVVTLILSSKSPRIIEKGFGAFAIATNQRIDETKLFFDTLPSPGLELLFGGLTDPGVHSLELAEYSPEYFTLGVRKSQISLGSAQNHMHTALQLQGIHLAAKYESTPTVCSHVLGILANNIDVVTTKQSIELVSTCVWYLWRFMSTVQERDELIVSCARVAHSDNYPTEVAKWALDILHQLVDPAEFEMIVEEISL